MMISIGKEQAGKIQVQEQMLDETLAKLQVGETRAESQSPLSSTERNRLRRIGESVVSGMETCCAPIAPAAT